MAEVAKTSELCEKARILVNPPAQDGNDRLEFGTAGGVQPGLFT
jgi:hypothetical protein